MSTYSVLVTLVSSSEVPNTVTDLLADALPFQTVSNYLTANTHLNHSWYMQLWACATFGTYSGHLRLFSSGSVHNTDCKIW